MKTLRDLGLPPALFAILLVAGCFDSTGSAGDPGTDRDLGRETVSDPGLDDGLTVDPGRDEGVIADPGPSDGVVPDAGQDDGMVADPGLDGAGDLPVDIAADPAGELASDVAQDVPDVDADVTPVSAWGWISAIEVNDACDQWYLKTQWFGGVRAYFAAAPNYNRSLPHTLGFAHPVDTEGDCTLYDSGIMRDDCLGMCACLDKGVECYNADQTERWCGEDQYCIENPDLPPGGFDHGLCADLPPHFDVGTVTIAGLKTPVSMAPDALDRYKASDLPNPDDLFDDGDAITATTSGGALEPLTFTAKGVVPLAVADPVVPYRKGQVSKVRWTPADPDARIQVILAAGSHDPNPLGGAILCDVPDGQAEVQVAPRLLERLYYLSCNGTWLMKCSRITRYSRDLQTGQGREVELFVGSARNLQIDWSQMQQ